MVNSTTFDILITNLPVQSTSTAYTIGLIARSNPVNLLATKTIPFNTVASSSGGRLTPRNTPNIHVTAVDRRFTRVERNIVSIEVDITNQSGYPEAINVRVRPETKVEWRCITPDPVDHCVEALNNDRLTAPLPEPISSLAPGESRRLRLNFALSPGEDQTVVDATHVFVVVTYDYVEGSGVSSGTTTDRLTVFLP
jgi:hypothetical protein